MSVYITREMLWQQAANDSNQESPRTILNRLARPMVRRLRRNRTIAELSALSDRELRDIGIYRGDIRRVAARLDEADYGLRRPARSAGRVAA